MAHGHPLVVSLLICTVTLMGAGGCTPARSPEQGRIAIARRVASRECRDGLASDRATRILALRGVDRVEPLIVERRTKQGVTTEVVGARVALVAAENLSPAYLEREVECHESDVVLGRAAVDEGDPFVLPSEWVDARVHGEGALLLIDLHPVTTEGAAETLARARRFADGRRGAELASLRCARALDPLHMSKMSTRPRRDGESPGPRGAVAHVLVIDDEDAIRRTLRLCLESAGYVVTVADSGEHGLAAARRQPPDVVLADLRLGGMDGLAVTRALTQDCPGLPVIVMTAYATIDNAVDAMRAGAVDYLPKPFTPHAVKHVVGRVLASAEMRQRLDEAERRQKRPSVESACAAVREAYTLAERAAQGEATVLLLGETGTGKGVLARHVHRSSPRAERPFVTVNCATISGALIENELFGHVRGAFTGADHAKAGYVEAAKNGTLFLDEVGDLSRETQGKLLRVLEEHEYVRVGDTEPRTTEARIVAATHRDLRAAVDAGTFREDLFYRLHVVAIRLPPLRERREDIPRLVASFLAQPSRSGGSRLKSVRDDAMSALTAYRWPGNLRELSNVIERAMLLADGEALTPDLLPEEVRACGPGVAARTANVDDESLEAAERRHIAEVLVRHPTLDGAAKALGVDPSTLYRKRERYGLR